MPGVVGKVVDLRTVNHGCAILWGVDTLFDPCKVSLFRLYLPHFGDESKTTRRDHLFDSGKGVFDP